MGIDKAAILAEGKFDSTDGKTAQGLVRYSKRYKIVGVIDSANAGRDAGEVSNGKKNGINVYSSFEETLLDNPDLSYLIIGVATAGGELPEKYGKTVENAINNGIHVVNGLHTFLSDDPKLSGIAKKKGVELIDVRKLFRNRATFFSGKINEVSAVKIAVLGTDSSIGKRTTAILLHQALNKRRKKSAFVAMGQTGWMQGFEYCIVLDSIVLDFVTGAIEDIIWKAWIKENPEFIVTHGEGAMLHPACPGGFELLAAGRPDHIVLQYSPTRRHYEDLPQYQMDSLEKNIRLIEIYTNKQPVAITLSSENMAESEALAKAREIETEYNIMTRIPFVQGVDDIVSILIGDG